MDLILHAANSTGNELMENCKGFDTSKPSLKSGLCGGYIVGVEAGYSAAVERFHGKPTYCVPVHVTNAQIIKVALKYMHEHPERLHFGPESLIITTMDIGFPCSDTSPQ